MDWSIPRTFYPVAMPAPWMWVLFVLACLAAIFGIGLIIKYKGVMTGLLLSVPIAVAMHPCRTTACEASVFDNTSRTLDTM